MFLTADAARARELAAKLHELNQDRQQTEAEITRAIFEQCVALPVTETDAALVFAGEGWHRGVVGIVASRVVERFHRPGVRAGHREGLAQGSGRSIPAFHLLEALETMPDLFTKFGGHRQAAGLLRWLPRWSRPFANAFRAYAANVLTPADFERELAIDSEIELDEIDRCGGRRYPAPGAVRLRQSRAGVRRARYRDRGGAGDSQRAAPVPAAAARMDEHYG